MIYARILLSAALLYAGLMLPARADDPRFDVAVTDAPARTFFEGLADGTPYNIVLEPDVGGAITLKMKNVSIVEVLDAVRDAYGYDYRRIPSGFVIVSPALQTRLFQVNYIDLERRGTSRTRVSSGQVGQSSNPQIVGGTVSVWIALAQTAISTAPAAPSMWPVAPLVELTTSLRACAPKTVLTACVSATSPWGVEVP